MSVSSATPSLSIVLPCLNEPGTLSDVVKQLRELYPEAELIVVDDGSDPPVSLSSDVNVLRHPYTIGNGAAIKTGTRFASGDILVFMDADGQHDPHDIGRLLEQIGSGHDLVVGAREFKGQASLGRAFANYIYNRLASAMTGFRIRDLTSGFRAVRAKQFRNFLYLLPNGFSYPTTSTMAFFRCGYSVAYVPIDVRPRVGKSKIRLFRDGIRFFAIILRIGALFSPMRFFLPISIALFIIGSFWYGYTYFVHHRFTNMGAVLYLAALSTFLFGVLSEQISALHYRYSDESRPSGRPERTEP